MMTRSKLLTALAVILVLGTGFHLVRHFGKDGPKPRTNQDQAQIGETLARLIREQTPANAPTTILYLFPADAAPYDSRAAALRDGLAEHAGAVSEIWAREEGHYNDDDYTPSIDIALKEHPDTKVLAIVAVGSVTHARVSPALADFAKHGGKLFLLGGSSKDAPFVEMAKRGYATLLASRTTWLKDAPADAALANEPPAVRDAFTLVGPTAD